MDDRRPAKVAKSKRVNVRNPIQSAISWSPIEPEYAELTEAFVRAMAVPYEERSAKEFEVIDRYWRMGLSLDPIMKFEGGKETLEELEIRGVKVMALQMARSAN